MFHQISQGTPHYREYPDSYETATGLQYFFVPCQTLPVTKEVEYIRISASFPLFSGAQCAEITADQRMAAIVLKGLRFCSVACRADQIKIQNTLRRTGRPIQNKIGTQEASSLMFIRMQEFMLLSAQIALRGYAFTGFLRNACFTASIFWRLSSSRFK